MENDDEIANCCSQCGGNGFLPVDCFEDICCCATPELTHDVIPCTAYP